MKLISKYNRVNLATAIVVIISISVLYYQVISLVLNRQVDQDLEVEEQEIFDFVKLNHRLPQVFKSTDQQIVFQNAGTSGINRRFIDTNFYNAKEKEKESGRGLISSVMVGGQNYKVQITESKVETEDLIKVIFSITLVLILVLLTALFIINRYVLQHLWQPFYGSLLRLKSFDIAGKENKLKQAESGITEFDELNLAIGSMADKVIKDYNELKVFTENASHELMTPIAVINSKLDNLLQTDQFTDGQSKLLEDLYQSVARLTHLNKSMLLLAKIENQILSDKKSIRLDTLLIGLTQRFNELFIMKNITLTSFIGLKEVTANEFLAEILLTNLLGNAIRHNRNNGKIEIKLDQNKLTISNTGLNDILLVDAIFNRFSKSPESEGSGLGLTISRQICTTSNWGLDYRFVEQLHCFMVKFDTKV